MLGEGGGLGDEGKGLIDDGLAPDEGEGGLGDGQNLVIFWVGGKGTILDGKGEFAVESEGDSDIFDMY